MSYRSLQAGVGCRAEQARAGEAYSRARRLALGFLFALSTKPARVVACSKSRGRTKHVAQCLYGHPSVHERSLE